MRYILAIHLVLASVVILSAQQMNPEDEATTLVGEFRDTVYLQQVDDDTLYRMYRITLAARRTERANPSSVVVLRLMTNGHWLSPVPEEPNIARGRRQLKIVWSPAISKMI